VDEDTWRKNPDSYFVLDGRTLVDCMVEVRAILDGQSEYMRYDSEGGRLHYDDKLRDRAQRLQALLLKAEGPAP